VVPIKLPAGVGAVDVSAPRAWLKKQHVKWLHEMEEAGTIKIYGEEKKTAHGH